MPNFLDIAELDRKTLRAILDDAISRKSRRGDRYKGELDDDQPLAGQILAMLFQKPSTRTRVSFDVAMRQLGGQVLAMNAGEMQLGRGESVADTARVLSSYVDLIMIRAYQHEVLEEMAANATVPVINGLTDRSHPCQIIADLMTYEECRGRVDNSRFAWCGDGNNVAATWAQASARFGFSLILASPSDLMLDPAVVSWANQNGGDVSTTTDPVEAVTEANCVLTDVWISMGDEYTNVITKDHRKTLLTPYRVTSSLMARASKDAIFMHCLPAHRDEEVEANVIGGSQSLVWQEAENRVHAQKSILMWCSKT